MQIGVLSARAGISPSRIRFYETRGVLPRPARLSSGYRDYDESALQTLSFIARGQALGFSLGEIAAHIHSPTNGKARKAQLLGKIESKLAELDELTAELEKRRTTFQALLQELRRSLRVDQP